MERHLNANVLYYYASFKEEKENYFLVLYKTIKINICTILPYF